jgi:lysine 6-dehydrogenase
MPNFLVLGAGQMAQGIVADLLRNKFNSVDIIDINQDSLDALKKLYPRQAKKSMLCTFRRDLHDVNIYKDVIEDADVIISTLPYSFALRWSLKAIEVGAHFIDLGGNNDVVAKQMILSDAARNHNVAIVPDCGLAPGLVSILAMNLLEEKDVVNNRYKYSIRMEVGGLPVRRDNPLEYSIVFSANGLINEYVEDAIILRDKELITLPSMTELEFTKFPWGFDCLEKFITSGGASTLPASLSKICRNVEYKTIRYPGHCERINFILDTFKHRREELENLLTAALPLNGPDVILLRVECLGHCVMTGRPHVVSKHEIIDFAQDGLTAMARMTAFPAAIIAQALADGTIDGRGTLKQEELFVNTTDYMINELKDRGITFIGDK